MFAHFGGRLNSAFILYLRIMFSIKQTCLSALPARLSGLFDLFLFIFTVENSTDAVWTLCAELQKSNSNFVKHKLKTNAHIYSEDYQY